MSRVAAVFNVSRKNRAMRPGRLGGAARFNDDVGSKDTRSSGSAIGERPSTAPGMLSGAGAVRRSAEGSSASGLGSAPWGLVRSRAMGPGDCKDTSF